MSHGKRGGGEGAKMAGLVSIKAWVRWDGVERNGADLKAMITDLCCGRGHEAQRRGRRGQGRAWRDERVDRRIVQGRRPWQADGWNRAGFACDLRLGEVPTDWNKQVKLGGGKEEGVRARAS